MRTTQSGAEGRVGLRAVVLFGASTVIVGALGSARLWAGHVAPSLLPFARSLPVVVTGEILAYCAVMLWHRRVSVPGSLVLSGVALGVGLRFFQAALAALVGSPAEAEGFGQAFSHYYASYLPAVMAQTAVTCLYLWLVRGAFEATDRRRSARKARRDAQQAPVLSPPVLTPEPDGRQLDPRERRRLLIEELRRREAEEAQALQAEESAPPAPAEPPSSDIAEAEPEAPVAEAEATPTAEAPEAAQQEPDEAERARLQAEAERARAQASAQSVLRALHAAEDDDEDHLDDDELPFVEALSRPLPPAVPPILEAEPPLNGVSDEAEQGAGEPSTAAEPVSPAPETEPVPDQVPDTDGGEPRDADEVPPLEDTPAVEEPSSAMDALDDEAGAAVPEPSRAALAVPLDGFSALAAALSHAGARLRLDEVVTERTDSGRAVCLASGLPSPSPGEALSAVEGLLAAGAGVPDSVEYGELSRVFARFGDGYVGATPLIRGRRGLCLAARLPREANLGVADVALGELEEAALQLELPHWPPCPPLDAPPAWTDPDLYGRVVPLLEWVPEVAGLTPMAATAAGRQVVILTVGPEASPHCAAAIAYGFAAAEKLCASLGQAPPDWVLWSAEGGAVACGCIKLSGQHVAVALMRPGEAAAAATNIQLGQILNAVARLTAPGT